MSPLLDAMVLERIICQPPTADGFAWTDDATIVPGPVGQRLAAGMRAAVAASARAGIDLLVDDVFIDAEWLDAWRHELSDLEWFLVGVVAPLEVCAFPPPKYCRNGGSPAPL